MAKRKVRYTYLGGPVGRSVLAHEYAALECIQRAEGAGFQTQEHAVTDREGKPLTVVSEHGASGVWCTYEFEGE